MPCFTSFLFDSHPSIMHVPGSYKCKLSCMTVCVFMYISMSVVLLMESMVMFIPGIFHLFFRVIFIGSQSSMYKSGKGLCIIFHLYWLILVECTVITGIGFPCLLEIALVVCSLLFHLLLLQNNSDGIFTGYVGCLMLHTVCCYTRFWHWTGFCW